MRHADIAKEAASRLTLELGLRTFTRRDLGAAGGGEEAQTFAGSALPSSPRTSRPIFARATIESITVLGALDAPPTSKPRSPIACAEGKQMGKPMKPRLVDAMGQALSLVRQSNLAEATALLRRALSGKAPGRRRDKDFGRPADAPAGPRPCAPAAASVGRGPARACARNPRRRPARRPSFSPGTHSASEFRKRLYRGPAGSLSYRLYLPADHESRDLALVLMLHGCTPKSGRFRPRDADEQPRRRVRPHRGLSAPAAARQRVRLLELVRPAPPRRGSGEPANWRGLAQGLAKEFGVGSERIFTAAGLSGGGAMAEVLAATYPDVFAAVGVHSGLPYRSAVDVPSAFAQR